LLNDLFLAAYTEFVLSDDTAKEKIEDSATKRAAADRYPSSGDPPQPAALNHPPGHVEAALADSVLKAGKNAPQYLSF
jgi:hypothetical protein